MYVAYVELFVSPEGNRAVCIIGMATCPAGPGCQIVRVGVAMLPLRAITRLLKILELAEEAVLENVDFVQLNLPPAFYLVVALVADFKTSLRLAPLMEKFQLSTYPSSDSVELFMLVDGVVFMG